MALPPRAHGRTRDRREGGDRGLGGSRVPSLDAAQALLPGAVGTALAPLESALRDVLIDELVKALASERVVVTTVDDPNGEIEQPAHAGNVVLDVRLLHLVEEHAALVYAVAREQRAVRLLPQPDLARRVSGEVEDREPSIAEVEHVTLVEDARRRRGVDPVVADLEPFEGQGRQQRLTNVVASELLGRVVLDAEAGEPLRVRDGLRVVAVNADLVELVETTGVIEVAMRGDGDGRPLEQLIELLAERGDPKTGVDEKVPFSPANQEHVPAEERVDLRLDDPDHAIVDRIVVEPTVDDAHRAGSYRFGGPRRRGIGPGCCGREEVSMAPDLLV